MSARQAALLAWPVARSFPRLPWIAGSAAAIGVASLSCEPAIQARLAAVALCLGAAFVLEDPAAATVAAVPPALLSRRIHRVASWLPALAAVWTLVLWLTGAPGAVSRTLELAGLLAATLAVAAAAGAVAAGPALLGALAADSLVSLRWTFLADAAWSGRRAAVLLGAGLAGVLVLSRDPARPRCHRERPA